MVMCFELNAELDLHALLTDDWLELGGVDAV